jgi:hypothetical protein
MPRIVTCHLCKLITRFPDVPKDTPMVPARMIFKDGTDFTYKDDDGLPVMVPRFDPMLEDFVERHEHGLEDSSHLRHGVIEVMQVEQKTWESMDVVKMVKSQLHEQTSQWYEDRDFYREGATECYNKHGNPTIEGGGCPDYMDDSRLIGKAEYHEDGRTITVPKKLRQYLCFQCPYQQSYINVELRRKAGMYR